MEAEEGGGENRMVGGEHLFSISWSGWGREAQITESWTAPHENQIAPEEHIRASW